MDDPGGVNAAQGSQQPVGQGVDRCGGQRPVLPYGLFEGGAGDVTGGHPGPFGVGVGIEYGSGVPPADAAGRLDLPAETGPELPVRDVLLVHHLHGDGAPARRTGQIHPPHPARTEPAQQRIGPDPPRITGHERPYALHRRVPPAAFARALAHAGPIPRWPCSLRSLTPGRSRARDQDRPETDHASMSRIAFRPGHGEERLGTLDGEWETGGRTAVPRPVRASRSQADTR